MVILIMIFYIGFLHFRQFNGEYFVGLFSSEDIEAGTELTYDYNFEAWGNLFLVI